MPQKIHYLDDIFFLSVLIKALDSGLSTEADPEHFRDSVTGNLEFIGSSLGLYLRLLDQNITLIDRAEYVKLLERTSRAYAFVLEKMLAGSYPVAAAYGGLRPRLADFRANADIFSDETRRAAGIYDGPGSRLGPRLGGRALGTPSWIDALDTEALHSARRPRGRNALIIEPRVLKGFRDYLPDAEIQRSALLASLETGIPFLRIRPQETLPPSNTPKYSWARAEAKPTNRSTAFAITGTETSLCVSI